MKLVEALLGVLALTQAVLGAPPPHLNHRHGRTVVEHHRRDGKHLLRRAVTLTQTNSEVSTNFVSRTDDGTFDAISYERYTSYTRPNKATVTNSEQTAIKARIFEDYKALLSDLASLNYADADALAALDPGQILFGTYIQDYYQTDMNVTQLVLDIPDPEEYDSVQTIYDALNTPFNYYVQLSLSIELVPRGAIELYWYYDYALMDDAELAVDDSDVTDDSESGDPSDEPVDDVIDDGTDESTDGEDPSVGDGSDESFDDSGNGDEFTDEPIDEEETTDEEEFIEEEEILPSESPSPSPSVSRRPSSSPSTSRAPSPSVSPSRSVIPSPSASSTPSASRPPSPTPSSSRSPSTTPSPTSSVTPSRSAKPSVTPSRTASPSASVSKSPSSTPSATRSPAVSPSSSRSPAASPSSSRIPSTTPSASKSPTPPPSVSRSPGPSRSPAATPSSSRSPSKSPRASPSSSKGFFAPAGSSFPPPVVTQTPAPRSS